MQSRILNKRINLAFFYLFCKHTKSSKCIKFFMDEHKSPKSKFSRGGGRGGGRGGKPHGQGQNIGHFAKQQRFQGIVVQVNIADNHGIVKKIDDGKQYSFYLDDLDVKVNTPISFLLRMTHNVCWWYFYFYILFFRVNWRIIFNTLNPLFLLPIRIHQHQLRQQLPHQQQRRRLPLLPRLLLP